MGQVVKVAFAGTLYSGTITKRYFAWGREVVEVTTTSGKIIITPADKLRK